jgi:thioredoxin reductase
MSNVPYDVVIAGGGPAGLSAALALGRARKRVLFCDAGPRRNAAAEEVHNFVTRDGTPPEKFRELGRAELARYPSVELRAALVTSVTGSRGAFHVELATGSVPARRVLLCTGMVDEMLPIEGFAELWGSAIFQCTYCHGWEVQDRRWGYLARSADMLHFGLKLRGWTRNLSVFSGGAFEVPDDDRRHFAAAGVRLETAAVTRLRAREGRLEAVELTGGLTVPCEVLFAHPPQRQVQLVGTLGLGLDEAGFVQVDPMTRETTVPGIYAAGDLTTRAQGAIIAAASGMQAAAAVNAELTSELALSGALDQPLD